MDRHPYRKDPRYSAICEVCGQGRAEALHDMLRWGRPASNGWYYAHPYSEGVVYRIRNRSHRTARWWPEYSTTDSENWVRIGDGVGVSLTRAKAMCEALRSQREAA